MSDDRRTEEPTPKRLRDARGRGDVARSSELNAAVLLIALVGALSGLGALALSTFRLFFDLAAAWARDGHSSIDSHSAVSFALEQFLRLATLPLGVLFAAAFLANFVQIGPLFTVTPATPDLQRLNPQSALKRLFGSEQIFDLLRTLAKLLIVAGVVSWAALDSVRALVETARHAPPSIAVAWTTILSTLTLKAGFALVLIGLLDLAHRRFQLRVRLRMTRDEVRREMRDEQGDPHHKAARTRLHHEILSQATIDAVRRATVVVTNPTQIAVAIQWDGVVLDAPRVTACGVERTARSMRELAFRERVPVVEFRELARALVDTPLWSEVEPRLARAVDVALRRARMTHGRFR